MPYLTDLADAARSSGLKVIEVHGWRTRGHGPMSAVRGIMAHHTATSAKATGDYPSLRVVRDGHSTLAGPLAQLGLGRSGTVYVIAAGRCWHAGPVDDDRYTNSACIGIEAEHDGLTRTWPRAQYEAYVRLVRALQDWYKTAPVRGHKEAATPRGRKVDPTFDMNAFRAAVASCGPAKKPATPAKKPTKKVPTFPGTVKRGSQGAAVRAYQSRLRDRGWRIAVDGIFGKDMERIVRAFQKEKRLTVDGIAGRRTWDALWTSPVT